MTTTIKVSAHCNEDTQVVVLEKDCGEGSVVTLQDGEEQEFYVHDSKNIAVCEALKTASPEVDESEEIYESHKRVKRTAMTRLEYSTYRGYKLPCSEDGADEGYLVEYLDGGKPNDDRHEGYVSWSPKAQFDNGYTLVSQTMSFGKAVEQMKRGEKAQRISWNGKGMWVIYNPGSKGKTHAMFDGSVYKMHGVDECEILPHFDMYTVNAEGRRAMLPGWLASQTDIDAEDWVVVK